MPVLATNHFFGERYSGHQLEGQAVKSSELMLIVCFERVRTANIDNFQNPTLKLPIKLIAEVFPATCVGEKKL